MEKEMGMGKFASGMYKWRSTLGARILVEQVKPPIAGMIYAIIFDHQAGIPNAYNRQGIARSTILVSSSLTPWRGITKNRTD
jgi:hypothetical protein